LGGDRSKGGGEGEQRGGRGICAVAKQDVKASDAPPGKATTAMFRGKGGGVKPAK